MKIASILIFEDKNPFWLNDDSAMKAFIIEVKEIE